MSWRVFYRADDDDADSGWKEVRATGAYGVAADSFQEVAFEPVRTRALRLEMQLQAKWSGGILEWKVR